MNLQKDRRGWSVGIFFTLGNLFLISGSEQKKQENTILN